jgi:hypothetical protein
MTLTTNKAFARVIDNCFTLAVFMSLTSTPLTVKLQKLHSMSIHC